MLVLWVARHACPYDVRRSLAAEPDGDGAPVSAMANCAGDALVGYGVARQPVAQI